MKIGIAGLPELTGNYTKALALSAGPVSVTADISLLPERSRGWDALLLPGGGDIDPKLLPERARPITGELMADPSARPFHSPRPERHCHNIDPELDRRQLDLLDWFIIRKKPVLGICKGMQLISLYFGGGFCEHLKTASAHQYIKYDQLHSTHAIPGSFLEELYGQVFTVNSAHHQGITAAGNKITVIQRSTDGVAEGLIHEELPVIGLQWHPERLCGSYARPDAVDGSRIFLHFFHYLE